MKEILDRAFSSMQTERYGVAAFSAASCEREHRKASPRHCRHQTDDGPQTAAT